VPNRDYRLSSQLLFFDREKDFSASSRFVLVEGNFRQIKKLPSSPPLSLRAEMRELLVPRKALAAGRADLRPRSRLMFHQRANAPDSREYNCFPQPNVQTVCLELRRRTDMKLLKIPKD
jgi:hypothetical protein